MSNPTRQFVMMCLVSIVVQFVANLLLSVIGIEWRITLFETIFLIFAYAVYDGIGEVAPGLRVG